MGIRIGRYVEGPDRPAETEFVCDSPALRAHLRRPWFRAFVARELGIAPAIAAAGTGPAEAVEAAEAPDWALDRHAFLVGAAGSPGSRSPSSSSSWTPAAPRSCSRRKGRRSRRCWRSPARGASRRSG